MKHHSLLLLSAAIAMHAGAGETSEITLSESQPALVQTVSAYFDEPNKPAVDTSERSIYIVELKGDAVATYAGGVQGFAATSPRVTGASKLDINSSASKSYASFLKDQQLATHEHCQTAFGRKIKVKHMYQHVLNGLAMELTAEEARQMAGLPEVKKIAKEEIHTPMTDVGPQWIGADTIWEDSYFPTYMEGSKGEGIVVAVFDTGINSKHPSFADIGDDGYDHENPLGSGNYIPGSYCETNPDFCNDKLIGAWGFTQGPEDPLSPEDSDGHGSHTASTVLGNVINDATILAPTTTLTRKISGVAPHANLIAYDVCDDGCPGSALIAAVEQVVKDASVLPNGIHALNYSISGGEDPYNDPVELGFLNASEAGIFVSASAGNSGPGASTVAHRSPWVATVAAMTHNRTLENSLLDLTSDGTSLSNMTAVGFTEGFGPAPIVHASAFPTANGSSNDTDPGQCLEPFPAGHFNGEIVVCDRGAIARVAKGQNVLAGGAGGFVLANTESSGESITGDAHFLPGVHIGFTDGEILRNWLATEENTVATISGATLNLDSANGDIMAGFSSRGPNLTDDILKPDVGAPGVSILAAVESDGVAGDDYGFLSGTSMSSPHNAGAAALISAVRPEWSPHEIKSAMMMTAKNYAMYKEDGLTPTDHFDVGAGRIDLTQVRDAGLVLDETTENFLAANPELGGDPKTLNIASMMDSNCVGNCSWTRTVTSANDRPTLYKLSATGPDGLELKVKPRRMVVWPGESKEVTVYANTTVADAGWNFAELALEPWGSRRGPDLHMPIAVKPAVTSDANLLNVTVDKAEAKRGDIVSYEITLANGQVSDVLNLVDVVPHNMRVVPSSLNAEITKGEELSPFEFKYGELSWSGTLEEGGLNLKEAGSPFGYVSLASLGVEPFGCPAENCDDGGVVLDVPSFTYNGETHTQVVWSVNGTLQAGRGDGTPTTASAQKLPSDTPPNNLLAPFWTDLDMGENGDGAEWYVGVFNAGGEQYTAYEWNNIPLFGDDSLRFTFQIWVQNGPSGNIWFVYQDIPTAQPGDTTVSVGVENADGTIGSAYYFGGEGSEPTPGVDLQVEQIVGGTAKFSFDAKVKYCREDKPMVNRVYLDTESTENSAIAVTKCVK